MTSRVQPAWAIHLQSGSQIPLEDEAARRYLRRGYLAEALLRGGDRPALVAGDITLSHDELRTAASGAAELQHRALSEPDVSLSAHPAPSIRLLA